MRRENTYSGKHDNASGASREDKFAKQRAPVADSSSNTSVSKMNGSSSDSKLAVRREREADEAEEGEDRVEPSNGSDQHQSKRPRLDIADEASTKTTASSKTLPDASTLPAR